MAWDRSRPIPWERLMREWVVYALIMAAVFLVFFRERNVVGALAGVLISGPLYLGIGAVLAKFGYQRKTLREMRSAREDATPTSNRSGDRGSNESVTPRTRPAPTRRTSTGPNRPGGRKRR